MAMAYQRKGPGPAKTGHKLENCATLRGRRWAATPGRSVSLAPSHRVKGFYATLAETGGRLGI